MGWIEFIRYSNKQRIAIGRRFLFDLIHIFMYIYVSSNDWDWEAQLIIKLKSLFFTFCWINYFGITIIESDGYIVRVEWMNSWFIGFLHLSSTFNLFLYSIDVRNSLVNFSLTYSIFYHILSILLINFSLFWLKAKKRQQAKINNWNVIQPCGINSLILLFCDFDHFDDGLFNIGLYRASVWLTQSYNLYWRPIKAL